MRLIDIVTFHVVQLSALRAAGDYHVLLAVCLLAKSKTLHQNLKQETFVHKHIRVVTIWTLQGYCCIVQVRRPISRTSVAIYICRHRSTKPDLEDVSLLHPSANDQRLRGSIVGNDFPNFALQLYMIASDGAVRGRCELPKGPC